MGRAIWLLGAILAALLSARTVSAEVDFAREVLPVLQRACFECHGKEKQEGGLRLDTAAGLSRGGDSGPVVLAHRPKESELLRRISLAKTDSEVMPNRGELLTTEEVAKIKQEPGKDIMIMGSLKLAQALRQHGLIDEFHINVGPLVLGGGTSLFGAGETLKLNLVDAKNLKGGVVALHYAKA